MIKKGILLAALAGLLAGMFLSCRHAYGSKNMTNWKKTNPELASFWGNFTKEVRSHGNLPVDERYYVVLAAHIGASGSDESFRETLVNALQEGVCAEKLMEVIYQTIPYTGMAKAYGFINTANNVFRDAGIPLPLKGQSSTSPETRLQKGIETQSAIFGAEHILSMRANAPEELKHIQNYLSANCFGDYYTRDGLNIKERELVTFAAIASLGGAEPQLKAHAQANLNVGNTKGTLLEAVTQMLPYIGYPRTLNAIAVINGTK